MLFMNEEDEKLLTYWALGGRVETTISNGTFSVCSLRLNPGDNRMKDCTKLKQVFGYT
jgi:hypothetical protein